MNKPALRIPFLGLIFLLGGCAQMANPTGGAKDDRPPALLRAVPSNQSTDFKSNIIRFDFDEYLTLNDISSEFIISPPMKTKPVVRLKKKSVIVTLKEPLRDSTTYTFNFGQSIGDLNENNRLKSFSYVFSTGSELDSLMVFGSVHDAYTGLPAEGVKVMLYDANEDSLPLTALPYYFGLTDKEGAFSVQNMKSGSYKVFALKEEMTDYLFNSPEENIAFSADLVVPKSLNDTNSSPIRLRIFNELKSKPYVKNTKSDSTGRLTVEMSTGLPSDYSVLPLGDFDIYTESTDSIRIWADVPVAKGSYRVAIFKDSTAIDTLTLRLSERPKAVKTDSGKGPKSGGSDSLIVRMDRPVKSVDASKIILTLDKDTLTFEARMNYNRPREVKFDTPLKLGKTYKATLLPGAIRTQAEGENKDTLEVSVSVNAPEYFGKINFTLAIDNSANLRGTGILQFVGAGGEVVFESESRSEQTFVLPRMAPGRYSVRLIEDANLNGLWDTGDYGLKRQPERVFNLSESIEVRSDWEQALRWELNTEQ